MVLTDSVSMKEADLNAIEIAEIPSTLLMTNAAQAVAEAAAEYIKPDSMAVVFCGCGNNGGDGIAVGSWLCRHGYAAAVYLVGDREKMTDDACEMERRFRELGGVLTDFPASNDEIDLYECSVIVDALFGTGLSRPLSGDALRAVKLMNASGIPIVSCDIASGVSADTGAILGDAVRASLTVTFSMPKVGHYAAPGCMCCGELRIADIGIPGEFLFGCGIKAVTAEDVKIPPRKRDAHKGDFGKILVIGGSVGMTGAPSFSAKAALRAGAGLVSVGVPEPIYQITAIKNDEAMPFPLAADTDGRLSSEALPVIFDKLENASVAVIGPGLGRSDSVTQTVFRLIRESRKPLILDADALHAVAENCDILLAAQSLCILTPHEGEFATLLGRPIEDRIRDAGDFAKQYGCIVVLKGMATVCAYPTGEIYVNTTGGPSLAKGGTGDVLTGIIAAMLCRLTIRNAVTTAVWLHGRAGDLCAAKFGENGVLASDVIEAIPAAMKEISERK